jgi:hypothetical protein
VINSGGTFTCLSTQTNLDLAVLRNATIDAGGLMAVDGKGFGLGAGSGAGVSSNSIGSGAGYGGNGGASSLSLGGVTYGSAQQPVDRGSGGGHGWQGTTGGGEGGGAIRFTVGGVLTVNGRVSAGGNAALQDDGGGGSGGSILLAAGALAGSGAIAADGGAGELYDGGGGGGGRIAIYTPVNVFTGQASAAGGSGVSPGQNGSIYSASLTSVRGVVTDTNGLPVPGVVLQPDSGALATTTDANGLYLLSLPPTMTVRVTPSAAGLVLVPSSRTYVNLTSAMTNENYLAVSTVMPALTNWVETNTYVLGWYGIPGVNYQALYSTNLVEWLPYGGTLPGTNGPLQLLVPMDTNPLGFFRVGASY